MKIFKAGFFYFISISVAVLIGIFFYFVFDITAKSEWNTVLLCMVFTTIIAGIIGFFFDLIKKMQVKKEKIEPPSPPIELPPPPLEPSNIFAPLKPSPPVKSAYAQPPIPIEQECDLKEVLSNETKKLREAKKAV